MELMRSYINHTNEILRDAGVPSSSLPSNALLEMSMNSLFAPGAEVKMGKKGSLLISGLGGKPKKERKLRDPNAPKRPLTAFFLYGTSARPIVKKDLGEGASAHDVSQEVLRRWTQMPPEEKEVCDLINGGYRVCRHD
jgi:transcriptional regulator HMO1